MKMITFFDYMQPLYKFLHSIRKVQDHISFDVKLPDHWLIQEYMEEGDGITLKFQDQQQGIKLWSFLCPFSDEGVNKIFDRIIYIIDKNIEEEKKQELLKQKISELKSRFANASLEELEQLKFTTNEEEHELTSNDGKSSEGTRTESATVGS